MTGTFANVTLWLSNTCSALAAAVGILLSTASACLLGLPALALGSLLVVVTCVSIVTVLFCGSWVVSFALPPTILSCAALVAAIAFFRLF